MTKNGKDHNEIFSQNFQENDGYTLSPADANFTQTNYEGGMEESGGAESA